MNRCGRFFKYQHVWALGKMIDNVVNYALASDACDSGPDLLQLYFYLIKLMEAAHLVDVREAPHNDDCLKE